MFLIKIEADKYIRHITPLLRMIDNVPCDAYFQTQSPVEVHQLSCGCSMKGHISCLDVWLTLPGNGCIICRNATIYLDKTPVKPGSPFESVDILRIKIPSEIATGPARQTPPTVSLKRYRLTYAEYYDAPSPDAAILQRQIVTVVFPHHAILRRDWCVLMIIASLLGVLIYIIYSLSRR